MESEQKTSGKEKVGRWSEGRKRQSREMERRGRWREGGDGVKGEMTLKILSHIKMAITVMPTI